MPTIAQAIRDQVDCVLALVAELLHELADDPAEFAGLDLEAVRPILLSAGQQFTAFLALSDTGEAVGVTTLTEAVAAYAGGRYGIISEFFVRPPHRRGGIGQQLLNAVKDYGRRCGWRRVDVTAPPDARWHRTVAFYEQNGFVFTGLKLRCPLMADGHIHSAG